ncbi:aminoglycoside 6'-N-acetyltransferase [Pseudochelatococcus sp. B33]
MGGDWRIVPCTDADTADWLALRHALWPGGSDLSHLSDMRAILARAPAAFAALLRTGDDAAVGFIEAMLRHDYVNGCETSPVAFVEGVLVREAWRRKGGARLLFGAAEAWARQLGCRELASDADIANTPSHAAHRALGFAETERVVYFRKPLDAP